MDTTSTDLTPIDAGDTLASNPLSLFSRSKNLTVTRVY